MNIKLHTPKSLQTGSGMSSIKQFLLALLATTISIVLTFGTAAIIENHKKKTAKKEMVMMVLNDFDKTIEIVESIDSGICECRRLQREIAIHPEQYDSLSKYLIQEMKDWNIVEFIETTERIFSTSIETFNTIGDVNFVNEVSDFYFCRRKYKEEVIDHLKENVTYKDISSSLKSLMSVEFPEYAYMNSVFLSDMKAYRDRCMLMMNISQEDLAKFSEQHTSKKADADRAAIKEKLMKEYFEHQEVLNQAREKLND